MTAVEFARRAAYLPAADALVVADVHLGRTRDSGVELPLGEGDARDRLAALLSRFDPAEVVVAGDLLHAFDRVPEAVEAAVEDLRATVEESGATFAVVSGNHDAMLASVLDGPLPDARRLEDGTVVAHGHDDPADADAVAAGEAHRYVVGHEHPAITIEGQRHPCFLVGDGVHRGADVLALPAFDRLARGTAVEGLLDGGVRSPVLAGTLGECRPVVYDDEAGEALTFPPLSDLQHHL